MNSAIMRNNIERVDIETATDFDDAYEEDDEDHGSAAEITLQPSGSRTLDKRLNPDAPDFVPALTARMLAEKIVDEFASYNSWSNAPDEDILYGPRYESIWHESSQQAQLEAQLVSQIRDAHVAADMQLTNNELTSDVEKQTPAKKRKMQQNALGSEQKPENRCCMCNIM